MKKSGFLLISVFIFFQAMSQSGQFGLQLSPLTTFVSKDNVTYSSDINLKPDLNLSTFAVGFKIGMNYSYMFKNNWALTPSVSYSMLPYAFKQNFTTSTGMTSYTETLRYGSTEFSVIGNKYFKIEENVLFGLKLGVGYASNYLRSISTSGFSMGNSSDSFSEISSANWDSERTYTARLITGVGLTKITKNNSRFEFAITYNHSFNEVSPFTMDRTVNGNRYVATLAPALSSLNFEFTYYFKPFSCRKK